MWPIFMRLISKVGVNQNMSQSWVFAYRDFQGLDMPTVYLEQTIAQLNSMITQTGGQPMSQTHLILATNKFSLNCIRQAVYSKKFLDAGSYCNGLLDTISVGGMFDLRN